MQDIRLLKIINTEFMVCVTAFSGYKSNANKPKRESSDGFVTNVIGDRQGS